MPFKKDENGALVLSENGQPIYVDISGKESAYDVDARMKQIAELTEKASRRGQEIEEIKAKYKALDGIEDLAAYMEKAKKDAETVEAMNAKDKESEMAVQKRIAEAVNAAVDPVKRERDELKAELTKTSDQYHKAKIGNAFGTSKYVANNLVNPVLAQQLFESNFYVKDDQIIGRDADGKDIFGPDGIAPFDLALTRLVEKSPFKENIVRANPGGSGTPNTDKQNPGSLTPEQIASMSPEAYDKMRREKRI